MKEFLWIESLKLWFRLQPRQQNHLVLNRHCLEGVSLSPRLSLGATKPKRIGGRTRKLALSCHDSWPRERPPPWREPRQGNELRWVQRACTPGKFSRWVCGRFLLFISCLSSFTSMSTYSYYNLGLTLQDYMAQYRPVISKDNCYTK
jgi:hypothetical protein